MNNVSAAAIGVVVGIAGYFYSRWRSGSDGRNRDSCICPICNKSTQDTATLQFPCEVHRACVACYEMVEKQGQDGCPICRKGKK